MRAGFLRKKIVIVFAVVLVLLVTVFALLLYFSNRLIKAEIEKTLGERGKIESISLGWNKVDVYGVDLLKDGQSYFRSRRVQVKASFLTLFGTRYAISDLTIDQPVIVLRIDAAGNVVNPMGGSPNEAEAKGRRRRRAPSTCTAWSFPTAQSRSTTNSSKVRARSS